MSNQDPTPATGPGRPPVGPPIQIRLPADLLAEIDVDAENLGLTRAAYIREVLEQLTRNRVVYALARGSDDE
jgi:hypothetical protein